MFFAVNGNGTYRYAFDDVNASATPKAAMPTIFPGVWSTRFAWDTDYHLTTIDTFSFVPLTGIESSPFLT